MRTLLFAIPLFFSSLAIADLPTADQIAQDSEKVAQDPGAISFTPPKGWRVADPKVLPKNVLIMVVGKGQHEYPPSLNLATDLHKGTLKEYLKIVKEINDADGSEWKDLGTITTQAGVGSLSEVTSRTQWGEVKMMHTILQKDETIYILTASALKVEFPKFYKEFFDSMKSLKINTETSHSKLDTKILSDSIAKI